MSSHEINPLLNDHLYVKVRVIPEAYMLGELWRADISVFDEKTKGKVPFGKKGADTYRLWATSEYLEDFAGVLNNKRGMKEFAKEYIKKRFDEATDNNGERTLEEIEEVSTVCKNGDCKRGIEWNFTH